MTFFADSYTLVEHAKGTPAYMRLFQEEDFVTTGPNVLEYATALLKRGIGAELESALTPVLANVVEPSTTIAAAAARFKVARKKAGAKCSHIDAWGYATAQSLGMPFLTGDEDFRGVPGVKFVKA